jgi:hypothetical protein
LQKLIVRPWSHLHSEYRCPKQTFVGSSHHLPPAIHDIPRIPVSCLLYCLNLPVHHSTKGGASKLENYSRVLRLSLGGCPFFSLARCPFRLNLNHTFRPRQVVAVAAPLPILRLFHQPALHRIPVHVAQLLDSLMVTEYIEIVIALLPNRLIHCSPLDFPPFAKTGRKGGPPILCTFILCSLRELICFSIWSTTAKLARSGSLRSRCTCSGITT